MLGTCSRCGYFPGSDSDFVGFAEQCKYRSGCGLCQDGEDARCMVGDKKGPTGIFEPCFAWSPSLSLQDNDSDIERLGIDKREL